MTNEDDCFCEQEEESAMLKEERDNAKREAFEAQREVSGHVTMIQELESERDEIRKTLERYSQSILEALNCT